MMRAGNAHINTYFSASAIAVTGNGRTTEMIHPKKNAVMTMPSTPRNYFAATVPQGMGTVCNVKQ